MLPYLLGGGLYLFFLMAYIVYSIYAFYQLGEFSYSDKIFNRILTFYLLISFLGISFVIILIIISLKQ